MYACLYAQVVPAEPFLSAMAGGFSPEIEETSLQAVLFSIAGLTRLLGLPLQIAEVIRQAVGSAPVKVHWAVASNPDSALLLASYYPETIAVTAEEERAYLAALPLTTLLKPDSSADVKMLVVLQGWGVQTCGELAALPEVGVAERLGSLGLHWRRLAQGQVHRPLRISLPITNYEDQVVLDHSVEQQESLLFLLSRSLQELCQRLQSQSQAAQGIKVEFVLEAQVHACEITFAVPLADPTAILKLLQLHLERNSPPGAVFGFTVWLVPAPARRIQNTLLDPPTPPADKLQITLARIAGYIGPEFVGCPRLLDTYRPDAFCLIPFPHLADSVKKAKIPPTANLRLVLRRFRPPLPARVRTQGGVPQFVQAASVQGRVRRCSGAWKTAGEWWVTTAWSREEWDIELDGGGLYRLSREQVTWQWYVEGMYD